MSKFLTKYDHVDVVSPHGGTSLTDPQFKDDCDINTILRRYNAGQLPRVRPVRYGDFSAVGDFADALNRVKAAESYFGNLPSEIRSRFNNDVSEFCDYVLNPANVDSCVNLGIFTKDNPDEDALSVLRSIRDGVTAKAASPAPNGEGNAPSTT